MQVAVKYTGTALPAAAATVSLFDTTVAFPGRNMLQTLGLARLMLDLSLDQDGTLTYYKSDDGGTTWLQLGTQNVTGGANTSTPVDFLIEEYRDWKVTFTVGAVDETVFAPSMSLTPSRNQG